MKLKTLVLALPFLLGACASPYQIYPTYAPPGAPQYKACQPGTGLWCRYVPTGIVVGVSVGRQRHSRSNGY